MQNYVMESVGLDVPASEAFAYIRDAANLPQWTNAFRSVRNGSATMETPKGSVAVSLEVDSSSAGGTIDWKMTFPDGSQTWAWSRVIATSTRSSLYSFVLPPPPGELERIEGDLETQAGALRSELGRLKTILEED